MNTALLTEIGSYHAHVYFRDGAERAIASQLRDRIAERFEAQMGRWHDVPTGPHQLPMYQVAFNIGIFAVLVPWLMLNRRGLTILIHPNTGNPRRDHLENALWLGQVLQIMNPEKLPESVLGHPEPLVVNTTPTIPA